MIGGMILMAIFAGVVSFIVALVSRVPAVLFICIIFFGMLLTGVGMNEWLIGSSAIFGILVGTYGGMNHS